MKRRRHTLQVSTFPFLAVLLSAMGALLVVLLSVDRKARLAALEKAQQATARAAEEAERIAAARRAEWENRKQEVQADWERKREELHARLSAEERELQARMSRLRNELADAASRLRAEQDQTGELGRRLEVERGLLEATEKALDASRNADGKVAVLSEAARANLVRMTTDVQQLEKALADLKAARERDRNTYSVVPYRGKNGESRKPLYVECAAAGLIFHPDRHTLTPSSAAAEVRAEVERRTAGQKDRPYLLVLVRPEGVPGYYHLQNALRGLDVEFGYEFIDADWNLDFPVTDDQPRTTVASANEQPSGTPLKGIPAAKDPPKAFSPVQGGEGSLPPLSSEHGGQGSGVRGWSPGNSRPSIGEGGEGSAIGKPGTAGPGIFQPADGTSHGTPGSSPSQGTPGSSPSQGGPSTSSPTGTEGPRGTNEGSSMNIGSAPSLGAPEPGGLSARQGSGMPSRDADKPGSGKPTPTAELGTNAGSATKGDEQASVHAPPPILPGDSDSGKGGSKPPGNVIAHTGNPSAEGNSRPGQSPGGSLLPTPERRPPPLRPARLTGDRDWLIFIECTEDGVILYPSRLSVPLSVLNHAAATNPLQQAVQQMIDRRQATVRPGELPFRPQIRFLVRPENMRSFHIAYPSLNSVQAPMTVQNLQPKDDVLSIMAGQ
jgi:hypothetical protein